MNSTKSHDFNILIADVSIINNNVDKYESQIGTEKLLMHFTKDPALQLGMVRTQNFPKINISYPLIRNASISENFAHVLNK